MVVQYVKGKSLFDSDADVLVNPVNTKGVMGAGLAKKFAIRFPEMYKDYRRACRREELRIYAKFEVEFRSKTKRMLVHEIYDWKPHVWVGVHNGKKVVILNFPTKIYWDLPSDYKIIEAGLEWLKNNIEKLSSVLGREVKKIAMPQLGCGLGKLEWSRVKCLIEKYFEDDDRVIIEVYLSQERTSSHQSNNKTSVKKRD